MYEQSKKFDEKEVELPETVYIRDVESKVFQSICLQVLAKIDGIGLLEGNIFDSLLGREVERVKGIYVDQDLKRQSVSIRVELNIEYGISIPEKAEEIQTKISEDVSRWTGLHVSAVHIVFKNLILSRPTDPEPEETPELEEAF
jgi:uncharacterized alkaline shock family protein YloU